MKDHNHNRLEKALSEMRTYSAPDMLWTRISDQLMDEVKESNRYEYESSLESLPQYDAPAQVWNNIEAVLHPAQTATSSSSTLQVVSTRRNRWIAWLSAAAVLSGLTIGLSFLLKSNQNNNLSYSQELLPNTNVSEERNNGEEQALTLIAQRCEAEKQLCQNPEYLNLQANLEELNQAKSRLEAALGEYSNDPDLAAQLAKIERDRSHIISKLISMS